MDGTDDDMLWNGSDEDGNVRKMKAQTVKMERVTLVGEGRENVTCFVYCVYEMNSKIFLLRRCLGEGGGVVILHLDKYIFPRQACFIWGSS